MASKPKNRSAAAVITVALATIVAAGEAGMYVPQAQAAAFVAQGLVETNPTMVNGDTIMTRATQKGVAEAANSQHESPLTDTGNTTVTDTASTASAVVTDKPKFEIELDIPVPENTRRGRTEMYPFNEMVKGASFFVPGKDPKSLASTLAGAMNRYSEVVPGKFVKNRKQEDVPEKTRTREFIARAETKAGVQGTRIYRTA